jgi:hypothetical protein
VIRMCNVHASCAQGAPVHLDSITGHDSPFGTPAIVPNGTYEMVHAVTKRANSSTARRQEFSRRAARGIGYGRQHPGGTNGGPPLLAFTDSPLLEPGAGI